MKRAMSFFLCVVLVFSAFTVIPVNASAATQVDMILEYARSKRGSTVYSGLCEKFVEECYQYAGLGRLWYANAKLAGDAQIISTRSDNIPVGACVYFLGGAYSATLGHVGIYSGNGKMIDAPSGAVVERSINWSGYRGWGYATGIAPTSSPPGKVTLNAITKDGFANFYTTDAITPSWGAVENATSYSYYLTQFPYGYAYESPTRSGTISVGYVTFTGLSAGRYAMFVQANNSAGTGPQSNWVEFVVDEPEYVATKTIIEDGHLYSVYDYTVSWVYAKELCERMGGHLVTITSQDEQHKIEQLITTGKRDGYWLGGSNYDASDYNAIGLPWKWVTSEEFSYSNWNPGEPNGGGQNASRAHFAEIRKSYGNKWDDASNTNINNRGFILEIELENLSPVSETVHGSNKYQLFDNQMTWMDAYFYCESIGGHLAAITSLEERQAIENLIDNGNKAWYWAGGFDASKAGVYLWVTEESLPNSGSYTNWMTDGKPNNLNGIKNHYLMIYKQNKKWTVLPNYYKTADEMKYLGFICEFENGAVPILIGDVNNDKYVNALDIAVITNSTYWLKSSSDAGYDIKVDLNGDGFINALDITVITNPQNWLKSS